MELYFSALYIFLIHLIYRAQAKKSDISSNNFTVLKVQGKHALADVIYCYKMTSVMALDDVTSLLRLKTLQIHVNVWDTVQLLAEMIQCNGGMLEEAVNFKCVFVVLLSVGIEKDQL